VKTALIVIDPQKIYTDRESEMFCPDSVATIDRINTLLERATASDQLVILVRHVHRQDGSDLGRLFDFAGDVVEDFNFKDSSEEVEYDDRLVRPPTPVEITKNRYSAFAGTSLTKVLKQQKVEKLTLCGFMTNFCCASTARNALDLDYFVDFVIDATGTPGTEKYSEKQVRTITRELLSAGFANVYTTKQYLKRS